MLRPDGGTTREHIAFGRCWGLLMLLVAGCGSAPQAAGPQYGSAPLSQAMPVYRLAIHPLHNPTKLIQTYHPLIDHLNARLHGARLTLEASRDYAAFEEKYRNRKPEFLLPNPWQTLHAMQAGYRVVAMAGERSDFKGLLIVRNDSTIVDPEDLKGRAVSYPSPTALAACIMPQYFLHLHGVDVTTDIVNSYVGSQESSIMNVFLGHSAAGATWPPPWRSFQKEHPQEAAALRVAWETEALVNNSVMVRDDVPAEVHEQVRRHLLELGASASGRTILANMETAWFGPASDQDYEAVRLYIGRFEREVRKVGDR